MAVDDFEGRVLDRLADIQLDVAALREELADAVIAAPLLGGWIGRGGDPPGLDAESLRPMARYAVRIARILREEAGKDDVAPPPPNPGAWLGHTP